MIEIKKLLVIGSIKLRKASCMKIPDDPTIEKTKKLPGINPKDLFSTIWPIKLKKVERINLLSPSFLVLKLICISLVLIEGLTIK